MSKERHRLSGYAGSPLPQKFTSEERERLLKHLLEARPTEATADEINVTFNRIEDATGIYLDQLKQGPPPTRKQLTDEIDQIRKLAGETLKLGDLMAQSSLPVVDLLSKVLKRAGGDWWELENSLTDDVFVDHLTILECFAVDLDLKGYAGTKQYAHWWVGQLFDIYLDFTKNTPGRIVRRREFSDHEKETLPTAELEKDSVEEFPFADWVIALAAIIGKGADVSKHLVRDVVHAKKPERPMEG